MTLNEHRITLFLIEEGMNKYNKSGKCYFVRKEIVSVVKDCWSFIDVITYIVF